MSPTSKGFINKPKKEIRNKVINKKCPQGEGGGGDVDITKLRAAHWLRSMHTIGFPLFSKEGTGESTHC